MDTLTRFSVDSLPDGRAAVVVDGADISAHLAAIRFESRPGYPPTLTLFEVASGSITGEGIVRVVETENTMATIAGFFAGLDPEELDKEVLNRMGWGDQRTSTAVLLTVLQELAGAGA